MARCSCISPLHGPAATGAATRSHFWNCPIAPAPQCPYRFNSSATILSPFARGLSRRSSPEWFSPNLPSIYSSISSRKPSLPKHHPRRNMHLPSGLLARLGQRLYEVLPIHVVQENVLAPIPSAHHAVDGASIFNPYFARHGPFFAFLPVKSQHKNEPYYGLTPFWSLCRGTCPGSRSALGRAACRRPANERLRKDKKGWQRTLW